ncbi:MAG: acyl-CoA thioesterase [Gammaproteobacteria bacterium]|nr:acyl-CoA thioesterase [Gammaproteobacteria bacterium]MDH5776732.1 acyl-CoA thioesterase [Gammaproteobacteria bacterium]
METNSLPKDSQVTIRVMAMPADTNAMGDIFGGWLMSQVDIAGSVAAFGEANGRVVTVAVNEFEFIKPVLVGDILSIFTEIKKIGTTSIQVSVEAFSERHQTHYECIKVAHALLTYVAIDQDRKPRPVKSP